MNAFLITFVVALTGGLVWWFVRQALRRSAPPQAPTSPAPHGAGGASDDTSTPPSTPAAPAGSADAATAESPAAPAASPQAAGSRSGGTAPAAEPMTMAPAEPVADAERSADSPPRSATATAEPEGPYGPGSAEPLPDGSAPSPEFTVKGNGTSKLYHTPESPYYKRTRAQVWFRSAEHAEAAGFRHWDRRRRKS